MTAPIAIKAARRLVADFRTWCQGARARDVAGDSVGALSMPHPKYPWAVRWCPEGAVVKVTLGGRWSVESADACTAALDILDAAAVELFGYSLTSVNDSPGGQEKALRIFDHALARVSS
jgi:hypothetical protein